MVSKWNMKLTEKKLKHFFVQFQCKREIPILREPNWENYIFIFRYIYAMHADAQFSANGTKNTYFELSIFTFILLF